MFYLIDEKDGLFNQTILVNALNLKSLEVSTGDEDYEVIFMHQSNENIFSFDPKSLFNVDNVIQQISHLKLPIYSNPFIIVTDIGNIENIEERFGGKSHLMNQATTILINIHDIGLVYSDEDDGFVISTSNNNFNIKESPEDVLNLIKEKIVPQEVPVIDTRPQWKTKL